MMRVTSSGKSDRRRTNGRIEARYKVPSALAIEGSPCTIFAHFLGNVQLLLGNVQLRKLHELGDRRMRPAGAT
jgi:hypothetical protein